MHLKKVGMGVTDLKTDFSDGIKLIKLVEVIAEEDFGKYNKKCVSKFQKIENLNKPLKYINSFLKDVGIRNVYSAENILEGNEMLILGMVWSLILRFNVSEVTEGDLNAKEALLLWAQTKVAEVTGGSVKINNFHTSWQDGVAFNALIQAYRPDLANYKELDPKAKTTNLNRAFDTAETKLSIPKLLDADDMVAIRPDEKSVMTYVGLFWKEFAANKRKKLAAEKIKTMAQRERDFANMQRRYIAGAKALSEYLSNKKSYLDAGVEGNSLSELEQVLRQHLDYQASEKPKKQQDLADLEHLDSSIRGQLKLLGRDFTPPEELSTAALNRWWEELHASELTFEENLRAQLKALKQTELLVKVFDSKAGKMEEWILSKEQSFAAASARIEEASAAPSQRRASEAAATTPREDAPQPSPRKSSAASATGFFSGLIGAVTGRQRQASSAATLPATPSAQGSSVSVRARSASLQEGTGREASVPSLRSLRSMPSAVGADVQASARGQAMSEGKLDSIAAVQAKLNMHAAYEEELAGRKETVPALDKLIERIVAIGCPPSRKVALTARLERVSESLGGLSATSDAYVSSLKNELERQEKMEEMRVSFAKRAEAINRWMEEAHDQLTEIFAVETSADAEQYLEELDGYTAPIADKEGELGELGNFLGEMVAMGAGANNPYSRFRIENLQQAMAHVKFAAADRRGALDEQLGRQKMLDGLKRDFAAAADVVVSFIQAQKAALDEAAPAINVTQDDEASIARAREILAMLDEMMASEAREGRAAHLDEANKLSDQLIHEVELDNPYTRQTMSSLRSMLEQYEKMVREKRAFVEAQLARAQTIVSDAEMDEMKKAFDHFDKSKDGYLNEHEFDAALKTLDLDMSEAEQKAAFERLASERDGGETKIGFQAFTTIILQSYKARAATLSCPARAATPSPVRAPHRRRRASLSLSQKKDTPEELVAAFRTVSSAKEGDVVTVDDLKTFLPEEDAAFLAECMADGGGGLDFSAYAASVYGGREPVPSTRASSARASAFAADAEDEPEAEEAGGDDEAISPPPSPAPPATDGDADAAAEAQPEPETESAEVAVASEGGDNGDDAADEAAATDVADGGDIVDGAADHDGGDNVDSSADNAAATE